MVAGQMTFLMGIRAVLQGCIVIVRVYRSLVLYEAHPVFTVGVSVM